MIESHQTSLENVQKEFDEFVVQVQSLEQQIHDGAQKTITQQIMKARVETMLEYHRGEQTLTDITDSVRIYNEAYQDDVFAPEGLEGDENAERSPQDTNPGDDQAQFLDF